MSPIPLTKYEIYLIYIDIVKSKPFAKNESTCGVKGNLLVKPQITKLYKSRCFEPYE